MVKIKIGNEIISRTHLKLALGKKEMDCTSLGSRAPGCCERVALTGLTCALLRTEVSWPYGIVQCTVYTEHIVTEVSWYCALGYHDLMVMCTMVSWLHGLMAL